MLQSECVANAEYKSSLEQDNADLRQTVTRQSQKVGQLQRRSAFGNDDTSRLHEIISIQHEKIAYYQQEIERSKKDMLRLEALLHQVVEKNNERKNLQDMSEVLFCDCE